MKRMFILILTFIMVNHLSMTYIDPLGNMSLKEVKEAANIEREYDEEARERLARETSLWEEEEVLVEKRVISYPDPIMRAGLHGNDRNVEAFEYEYSDGTTEIISEDGRILKSRK